MKFSIGYQLPGADEDDSILKVVEDFRPHVEEVYFPWADLPSGRAALNSRRGHVDWSAQERLEGDLRALRKMGVKLDLLFNANCYGGQAASQFLQNQVRSVLDRLGEAAGGVDAVTTTSLAVAHVVKRHCPGIDVRASVNMRLGTVQAMEYAKDLFDSFHVQRDWNRDLDRLGELADWARRRGKRLHMLANSGCLRFCPAQTFHDNLVAHEREVDETRNIEDWNPHLCWNLYRRRENWPAILQSTWVRPEDLHHYEGLFPVVKLATRMHDNPRAVVGAYARGRYDGNLLDLLEPGFGPILAPFVIDNRRFPPDWFEHSIRCRPSDRPCEYCRDVLDRVLVSVA